MKIVVSWPRFGPYHLARLRYSARYLAERGHQLVGLETAPLDTIYAWREETQADGFERVQMFPGQTFNHLTPQQQHRGMQEVLNRVQPDVVAITSYGHPDSRSALLWCRTHRKPGILMYDTTAQDAVRVGWRERIKSRLVAQYDAALVAGTLSRQYLEGLGFPRDAIFRGIDVVDNAWFAETARSAPRTPPLPELEPSQPYFLASNRFIARKNLPRLLDAYAAYRTQSAAPWPLVMLGDGVLRDELQARATALGLEGSVLWAGFRQIEELPAFYAHAGAFVHPAEADQWALVVNEAMACGLPVLVSRGAGCWPDLVEEGVNGFTFAPTDTEALTQGFLALSAPDTNLRAMGEASRERIAQWTLHTFAESLLHAAETGRRSADRGPDPLVSLFIRALALSRKVDAFHTVEA